MTGEEKRFRVRVAAILDCEGSIGIYHHHHRASGTHTWHFAVVFAQKQRERLEAIQARLGGDILYNRESYRLKWDRRKAIKVLRYLLPFIEWKKAQAELFLKVHEIWPKGDFRKGIPRGDRLVPLAVTIERANLANSVNALNEGGRTKVIYRVIPSQSLDAVDEANDGAGVTVIHETLRKPRAKR